MSKVSLVSTQQPGAPNKNSRPAASWNPNLKGANLPRAAANGITQGFSLLYSLRDTANQTQTDLNNMVQYGTWQERVQTSPQGLPNGAVWYHTDFLGAVYQVRLDPNSTTLQWFWASGVIWLPPGVTFNVSLGPNDIGLLIATHGYLMVWDGVGPQLQCQIFGPCAAAGGGGTTGQGSQAGGSGGGGTGTGGSGPPSTNPIPPGVTVAGPVGNFQVSNTTLDLGAGTVTGTFSWTLPTVNLSQFAGVQLWIIGGAAVEQIGHQSGPTETSQVVTIPIPQLGVFPLTIAAITIDSSIGITMDPSTETGQASPKIIWTTGAGGGNPGKVANFVLVNQTVNPDGSVTALFSWDMSLIIGGIGAINFAGVQLWRVASSGAEPQAMLGGVTGQAQSAATSATVTAPASAVGETWTVAAITVNTVGTLGDLPSAYGTINFQAQTRAWQIGG